MEDERQVARLGLDLLQAVEGQALPVDGIDAVDVANAAGQEVNAQVGDGLALLGVGQLALGGHAVLGATNSTDLSLDGDALVVGKLHDLGGVGKVGLEVLLVRAASRRT